MARTGASSTETEVRKEVKSENNSVSRRSEQRKLTLQNHDKQDGLMRVKRPRHGERI